MEKFKQKLKTKIGDQKAAFAILAAVVITFAVTISVYEYIKYSQLESVDSSVEMSQIEQQGQEALENANSVANEMTNEMTNELQETEINEEEVKSKNEEEYEKLKKENKISSAADKYYIKVNYGAQVVTVYTKDSNGKYTKPVKAMICSTGTYTPKSGTYRTLGKQNWWRLKGGVYGQYSTHIMGNILFHSVPYLKKGDKSSLEYWAYDQLGKKVSLGCVRLTVKDAKWIYNNCPIGTQVEFYSSSNPGPLGKPTAMKISDAPSNIRGWDPTDPDKNNPWPEYLEGLKNQENDDKNNNDKPSTGNNDKTNEVDTNTTVNEVTNTTTNETSGNTTTNTTTNETTNEAEENTTTNETTNKPEEGKDNTSSAQTSTNELESMAVNNV